MSGNQSLCDETVYAAIYRSYSSRLFNYIYYKCGDESLSQDVIQEAFMKMWQNCSSVAVSAAQGYVFTTARNHLYNIFSKNQVRLKFVSASTVKHDIESPEYILEKEEFREQLENTISELPEKQREVFLMSRIDKMKYKEIASLLGISEKAVEKRMYAALSHLRKLHKNIR